MKVVNNRKSCTVIDCLEEMFEMYGISYVDIIQSDNGKEFRSQKLIDFAESIGGKVVHGSLRHPQSQGAVERVHLTVKDILHSLELKSGGTVSVH